MKRNHITIIKNKDGFSIAESLTTLFILSLLFILVLMTISLTISTNKEILLEENMNLSISNAYELFNNSPGSFETNITTLNYKYTGQYFIYSIYANDDSIISYKIRKSYQDITVLVYKGDELYETWYRKKGSSLLSTLIYLFVISLSIGLVYITFLTTNHFVERQSIYNHMIREQTEQDYMTMIKKKYTASKDNTFQMDDTSNTYYKFYSHNDYLIVERYNE